MVGLREGFLFRGALSIGDFVQSEATVIGPAITDAACWYEMADWFGIIATPSCGHRLSYFAEILKKENKDLHAWYVEYEVPLKKGKKHSLWVVSWPAQYPPILGNVMDVGPKKLFLAHLRDFPVPGGTEAKYSNTITFFDWYCREIGVSVVTGNNDSE